MSVPATEYWFSLSIRRNRKSYMLASLLLTAIMLAVVLVLWFFNAGSNAGWIIFAIFFVPYFVGGYLLTAQRLRDMNLTGWLAVLWVPIAIADKFVGGAASLAFIVVLCVVPGTKGTNNFGPDPLG